MSPGHWHSLWHVASLGKGLQDIEFTMKTSNAGGRPLGGCHVAVGHSSPDTLVPTLPALKADLELRQESSPLRALMQVHILPLEVICPLEAWSLFCPNGSSSPKL